MKQQKTLLNVSSALLPFVFGCLAWAQTQSAPGFLSSTIQMLQQSAAQNAAQLRGYQWIENHHRDCGRPHAAGAEITMPFWPGWNPRANTPRCATERKPAIEGWPRDEVEGTQKDGRNRRRNGSSARSHGHVSSLESGPPHAGCADATGGLRA